MSVYTNEDRFSMTAERYLGNVLMIAILHNNIE